MNMTTISIIVAGVTLALAIQIALFQFWGIRKFYAILKNIEEKMAQHFQNPMQMLVNKYAPGGDFEEEYEDAGNTHYGTATTSTQFVETPAPDKEKTDTSNKPEGKSEAPSEPAGKPSPNEAHLQIAYSVFSAKYKNLCAQLDVHNYKQLAPQMARLLIEMGVWLKDFLPISQDDFNSTEVQKTNVNSIGLPQDMRDQRIADAPVPTGNTNSTPMEVIALNHILQEWGVDDLQLLISGYQYKKDKEAKK